MYTYLQTLHVIQDLKDHQDQTHIKAALTGFYSTPAPLQPMHHALVFGLSKLIRFVDFIIPGSRLVVRIITTRLVSTFRTIHKYHTAGINILHIAMRIGVSDVYMSTSDACKTF